MLDIIIHNGIVLTMENENGVGIIENGAVGISGDSITVVGDSKEVMRQYKAHRYIDAKNKVVMPGLVDAHMHSEMGLLKGLAQDSDNWMQSCLWPLTEVITPEEKKIGSMVTLIEALKAGTTTMSDYNDDMGLLVENHIQLGTRLCMTPTIHALPDNASDTPIGDLYPLDSAIENRLLEENKRLIQKYHMSYGGRIKCMLGPVAPDRVTQSLLVEINELSKKENLSVHMHVACGVRETNQIFKRYGKRSIQFLDELNMLNERMIGVHLSEATEEELKLYAGKGAAMVLCSGSEAIIDGNIPPAYCFRQFSKNLALGSDQTSGGNTSNMFNEMKFTAILNKCKFTDPVVFPSWQVLRMATVDGARAIGMGDEVGSLKEGKKADVIIIDFMQPTLTPILFGPIRNIVPNLVYAANGSEVQTSIINGKVVMENRILINVNVEEAVIKATDAAQTLTKRAETKLMATNSKMVRMMKENRI